MFRIEIENKISDAFQGGEIRCRELRLSGEEAEYICDQYCGARIIQIGPMSDKAWYEISFEGAE